MRQLTAYPFGDRDQQKRKEHGYKVIDTEKLAYLVLQGSTHAGSNPFPNTAVKHIYLTDSREDALSYIAYWAGACKSAGAEFHYGDAWEYDENGVPQLKEE